MRKLTPERARETRESALAWVATKRAREQAQESGTSPDSSSPSEPVELPDSSSLLEQSDRQYDNELSN
ncbi:hypothetical protein H6F90_29815 [Trichocoleus sp. FACHB-591]|uniref:hypothetical protein n=1 Tax=Trichocoleus sp. FACHB-591 TaxID=2692872 RepID=UPI0016821A78|nr:hypothetical protein [Trichocoleus sp. FACHB-591]MBD2099264.1 hypothetical protein [Trichocoleus sp. FACHB-591]